LWLNLSTSSKRAIAGPVSAVIRGGGQRRIMGLAGTTGTGRNPVPCLARRAGWLSRGNRLTLFFISANRVWTRLASNSLGFIPI
jgi:hypothetical protein